MEVKIERLNDQAEGIGYINNKVTFIKNTLVGDIVDTIITEEHKKYNVAKVSKIIFPSPIRQKSFCPISKNCGGCPLAITSYNNTLEFKKKKLAGILSKYANFKSNIPIVPSIDTLSYRNKITLHIKNKIVGYYTSDTNDVVLVNNCPIASESINLFIEEIPKYGVINGEVVIRSNYQGELLVNFLTEDKITIIPSNLNIKGLLQNGKILCGQDYFVERVGDFYFNVSYNSFFQINRYICEKLFETLEKYILKNQVVLDLYCGVGTLGQSIAKISKKVYGIEIVSNAIVNAKANALINNIHNVTYFTGDVASNLSKIKEDVDVIICDPPRSGLDKKTINQIIQFKPKQLIYISCNPLTLARDLNSFSMYQITNIEGFDMFPYTSHVECISVLYRKNFEK